ncbi:hypothetical protein T12_3811 [Trichinella patagoniensis]|uniref:Uncharacterized protein n=1 Tax=Trichinella patagoniensis TaxID=990121 RepID=A0A0V1A2B4_9BILA|nr:hypothetical protein T12_3811 [Trichinella patagoniensis]
MEKISNGRSLIGTGAAVSLLPATGSQKQQARVASNQPILQAVNETPVSYLGMLNFCRRFLPHIATHWHPWTSLNRRQHRPSTS